MARMQRSLFAQLNALAEEISQGAVKAAAEKAAGPTPADPGTYMGASSHPTANVDNNVQAATEGARAHEYEADIKKQQGALSVDSTPEMSQEGRQDDVQLNIGTNAKATGEDPASEKDFKGTKDDPGTSHPAKTNDGEKYSSVNFKEARERAGALGNDILANLINFGTDRLTKQSESAATKQAEMPAFLKKKIEEKKDNKKHEASESPAEEAAKEKAEDTKAAAFKAGYELAAVLGLDKEAAEASVREVCANTIRNADEMASLVLGFLSTKAAEADPTEDASEGEDHSAPADVESGEGADVGGGGAGGAPAGLEAMLGGAGGGDAGGAPAAGGDAGGAPSDEDAIQELAMALEELGIPPEALMQALSQGGESGMGGEGGAAAMGGMGGPGMSPADAGIPAEAPKMAAAKAANDLAAIGSAVMNFKRSGRFQIKEARTKRSRELRDMMKQHVLELVNR